MSEDLDKRMVSLLAPLDRVEPARRGPKRSRELAWRVPLAVAVTALVAVGVAMAATSWTPFAGISSADHPATSSDLLDGPVIDQLRLDESPIENHGDQIGTHLNDSARFVGALPDGRKLYVVATTKERLCVVAASLAESCGYALSHDSPITMTVVEEGPGEPPLVYGVAVDGVDSVSFEVNGSPITVPVHQNVYAYQGSAAEAQASISGTVVQFSDGSRLALG